MMTKRMAVVVSAIGWPEIVEEAVEYAKKNSTEELTDVFIVDNGSTEPIPQFEADTLIRFDRNTGGNAILHNTLPWLQEYEFVAHIHCDLMIVESGWDVRVLAEFDKDPKLALLGFVGSNELDYMGGRGRGTMLNYQGLEYRWGRAMAAKVHGKQITELVPGASLDHCSLVFRRRVLEQLPPQEGNYSPGHFYDRILSCEVVHRGFHLGVMGIACDHRSGGSAGGQVEAQELYKRWLKEEGLSYNPENPDTAVYVEGEKRFLTKWRDQLKFVPFKVGKDYSITFQHPHRSDQSSIMFTQVQ